MSRPCNELLSARPSKRPSTMSHYSASAIVMCTCIVFGFLRLALGHAREQLAGRIAGFLPSNIRCPFLTSLSGCWASNEHRINCTLHTCPVRSGVPMSYFECPAAAEPWPPAAATLPSKAVRCIKNASALDGAMHFFPNEHNYPVTIETSAKLAASMQEQGLLPMSGAADTHHGRSPLGWRPTSQQRTRATAPEAAAAWRAGWCTARRCPKCVCRR